MKQRQNNFRQHKINCTATEIDGHREGVRERDMLLQKRL